MDSHVKFIAQLAGLHDSSRMACNLGLSLALP
jgi:hypothetical protein